MSKKIKIRHVPVLTSEVIQFLNPGENKNFIDCTLGTGGHAKEILKRTGPAGKLLGIDLDQAALDIAGDELQEYSGRIILAKGNFKNIKKLTDDQQFNKINGILLDLGISSLQLAEADRGFSFQKEGRLDMEFGGQDQKISQVKAHKIINYFTEQELAAIFRDYGEEKYARAIARKIVQVRKIAPIKTTTELVELIKKAVPAGYLHRRIHPATRVFQALRIAVNQELENLKEILPAAVDILEPGGRLVVIAYHSLEDRIVKRFFRQEAKDCLCPPQLPDCRCDHQAQIKILTPRVVKPGREEILKNPRSRSAKLRAVEKI